MTCAEAAPSRPAQLFRWPKYWRPFRCRTDWIDRAALRRAEIFPCASPAAGPCCFPCVCWLRSVLSVKRPFTIVGSPSRCARSGSVMEASDRRTVDEQSKPPWQYPKGVSGNKAGRPNIKVRAGEKRRRAVNRLPQSEPDRHAHFEASGDDDRAQRKHFFVRHADAAIRLSSESRRLLLMLKRHAPKRDSELTETFTDIAAHAQAESEVRRAAELAADEVVAGDEAPTTVVPTGRHLLRSPSRRWPSTPNRSRMPTPSG